MAIGVTFPLITAGVDLSIGTGLICYSLLGGYLIGFIFMSVIAGISIQKSRGNLWISVLGMTIGTLIAYLFGTIWFVIEADCTLWYALTVCVFPFLIGDAVKILLSAKIGPMLRGILSKANLLESLDKKN